MSYQHILLFATVVVGVGAGTALAGSKDASHDAARDAEAFEALDRDGNGALSRSEFERVAAPAMGHAALDANEDGEVDRLEFAAFEGADADAADYESDAYMADDYGTSPDAQRPTEAVDDYGSND